MSFGIILLILLAALLHASWNAVIKGGSNNPQILNLSEGIIISQAMEMRQFKAWIAEHHKK